ncbi:hypothetical protein PDE_06108 [Penicillium oxalicum 114-2]|uniref:Uncharacterized protein n=1 Tax=Penicillium oxalicum (strain 114-2 / CGMCC 5302) TaxID=933388 RepID=S8AXR8_PENO1|nr:hypothetical protein PDE_06108 [Penicillium oxalicum 114-2]
MSNTPIQGSETINQATHLFPIYPFALPPTWKLQKGSRANLTAWRIGVKGILAQLNLLGIIDIKTPHPPESDLKYGLWTHGTMVVKYWILNQLDLKGEETPASKAVASLWKTTRQGQDSSIAYVRAWKGAVTRLNEEAIPVSPCFALESMFLELYVEMPTAINSLRDRQDLGPKMTHRTFLEICDSIMAELP